MKRLISTVIGTLALIGSWCMAGNPNLILWSSVSCETNAAATVTHTPDSDVNYSGWIESVIVDLSGAINTGTVAIVTSTTDSGTGYSRTILSKSVTGDEEINPRLIADTTAGVDITGEPVKFPLLGNKISLTAYGFTSTNTTAKVYLIFSNTP